MLIVLFVLLDGFHPIKLILKNRCMRKIAIKWHALYPPKCFHKQLHRSPSIIKQTDIRIVANFKIVLVQNLSTNRKLHDQNSQQTMSAM